MITVYRLVDEQLKIDNLSLTDNLPGDALWLDVVEPSRQERIWLEQYYEEDVPDREDLNELESTSRFYQDEDGIHIHSFFPHRQGKDVRLTSVSFNLRPHLLITLRDDDVGLFRLVRSHFKRNKVQIDSPMEIFSQLFTAKIDYLADMLEEVYSVLEALSQRTLRDDSDAADERDDVLRTITSQEDINDKIRLCLLDTQRSIRYLTRNRSFQLSETHHENMMNMLRDVESLSPHTQFLFGKMNFLLDAIMGFISHEQNNVNKIFTFIATLFLPPTLVGSIYGMNFKMPELDWAHGYAFALGLMVLSAVLPWLYFKRKGWL